MFRTARTYPGWTWTRRPRQVVERIALSRARDRRRFRLEFIATWLDPGRRAGPGDRLDGPVKADFMVEWAPFIIGGVSITIFVSVLSIIFATMFAVVGALGRLSTIAPIYATATLYVSLVRGTPLIVQLIFWYLALPQFGIVLPGLVCGIFGLAFNYGAYMTEIFRAGIQAIPRGQIEAAAALGMTGRLTMRRIVLPQATRIVIPAIGNEFIAMIKDSALVSYVGIQETFWRASTTGSRSVPDVRDAADRRPDLLGPDDRVLVAPGTPGAAHARERRADMSFIDQPERLRPDRARSRGSTPRRPSPSATRTRGRASSRPTGARPIVKVLGLEKFFGSNHVLRGCTLEVYPSETICLIGKSGSGKSTLLRCTNFLEEPTMGSIEVGGIRVDADPLNPRSRTHREQIRQIRLGAQMVFQEFNLFPHLRVIDNLIEAPIRVKGMRATRPSRRPRSSSTRSACPTSATSTRPACPAGRSSAWRSPAP